jgi:hypothetical protein
VALVRAHGAGVGHADVAAEEDGLLVAVAARLEAHEPFDLDSGEG